MSTQGERIKAPSNFMPGKGGPHIPNFAGYIAKVATNTPQKMDAGQNEVTPRIGSLWLLSFYLFGTSYHVYPISKTPLRDAFLQQSLYVPISIP